MDKLGIVFFPSGELKEFGNYVSANDPLYFKTPGHEDSFKQEILPSFEFKINNLIYTEEEGFYKNALNLASQGLVIALKNDDSILVYATSKPTIEQLNSILSNEKINSIDAQEVYEIVDEDDFISHNNLKEYALSKLNEIDSYKARTA